MISCSAERGTTLFKPQSIKTYGDFGNAVQGSSRESKSRLQLMDALIAVPSARWLVPKPGVKQQIAGGLAKE